MPFEPDLAVEILSPADSASDVSLKIQQYLRYGTRLVWIVDPDEQTVHVYRPTGEARQGSVRFITIDDMLDGEDVLPGFSLPLRELFQPPAAT